MYNNRANIATEKFIFIFRQWHSENALIFSKYAGFYSGKR